MKPSPKRPMTPDEAMAIDGLRGVTFPVASWDKRFYRDVLSHARQIGIIGEKSVPQLWRLFIRYRRQIDVPDKQRLLKLAADLAAPDFRKQQAAASAQRRIDDLKQQYSASLTTPTGLHNTAQGCEARATLGKCVKVSSNPEGVAS